MPKRRAGPKKALQKTNLYERLDTLISEVADLLARIENLERKRILLEKLELNKRQRTEFLFFLANQHKIEWPLEHTETLVLPHDPEELGPILTETSIPVLKY